MDERLIQGLEEGAKELGIALDNEALGRFSRYFDELFAWNKKINLISRASGDDIVERHFLDSFTLLRVIAALEVKTLLDMGAGGGFPGLVLKIAEPALDVVLVDSVDKKVHFLRHVIRTLGLDGVSAISARLEEPETVRALNGFDCVTSRAFSELREFVRLGMPYLRPGGRLLAIKGPKAAEEVASVASVEGAEVEDMVEVKVPFSERANTIVVVRKPG